MNWGQFADSAPGLAEAGRACLSGRVAYLATLRRDGSPRVHPVSPDISTRGLFVFMEPTSPKGKDLRRDGRYSLHSSVEQGPGGYLEFFVAGQATVVESADVRAEAAAAAGAQGDNPAESYILFELSLEEVLFTSYVSGSPRRQRWSAGTPA